METFSSRRQRNPLSYPKKSSMPPEFRHVSLENMRLAGQNTGASMISDGSSGEASGNCSINIYINNDIQGINNSVLIGSDVRLGDPGVSLCFKDLKMDRGVRLVSRKKGKDSLVVWLLLVAFIVLAISVFVYV